MLDTVQNNVSKAESAIQKRPNSPSNEVAKLESRFENILSKQTKAQKEKLEREAKAKEATKEAQDIKATKATATKDTKDVKGAKEALSAKTETKNKLAQQTKATTSAIDQKADVKESGLEPNTKASTSNIKATSTKDTLQESRIKTASAKTQNSPLAEALSATSASAVAAESSKVDTKAQASAKTTAPSEAPSNAISSNATKAQSQNLAKSTMPLSTPLATNIASEAKSLADIEQVAKQKGLNPSKISLQSNESEVAQKPLSAQEKIQYKHEKGDEKVAIIDRGANKPRNITTKISKEYPIKSAEEESGSGSLFSLKDRA